MSFITGLKTVGMYVVRNAPKVIGGVALSTVTFYATSAVCESVADWNKERIQKNKDKEAYEKSKAQESGPQAKAA